MSTCKAIALALLLVTLASPAVVCAQATSSRGGLAASIQSPTSPAEGPAAEREPEQPARERNPWAPFAAELAAREQQIRGELAGQRLSAEARARYFARLDLDELDFCSNFDQTDILASTHFISLSIPTFKTLWAASLERGPHGARPTFVPELVEHVERCDYTRGALYRAAFMLEYMYWNRMLDRVGMEVAEALRYRDYFYNLKFIDIAREKIARARGEDDSPMRTRADFFEAPKMGLAFFLRAFGLVTTSFPPRRRRTFMAMIDILDIRRGSKIMFGSDLIAMLDAPEDLELAARYFEYMLELEAHPERLGVPHGGWYKLMELTGGDRARGLRVITLLSSLRGWVLEDLADALIKKGRLTPTQLRAFYSGANTYFMLHRFDELFALDGKDAYTLRYHFFYPPDYEASNWKAYHWFANAHLGCRLARRGMDRRSVKISTRRLAQVYEAITLNLAIPTKRAIGEEPRARAIVEGWEDIILNEEGGDYGWGVCAKK